MAKPEWGTKRTCQSCGARFYDLGRSEIVCPACGTVFDLELLNRARRARPAVRAAAVADEAEAATDDTDLGNADLGELDDEVEVEEDEGVIEGDDAQDEDEGLIEDASELGEDDMSDVIDSDIDEEEPR